MTKKQKEELWSLLFEWKDEILEEYFIIANQHVHVLDEFNSFMEEEIYQLKKL